MNAMAFGYLELLILLAVVILLFGGKQVPKLARGLGASWREFKKGKDDGPRHLDIKSDKV